MKLFLSKLSNVGAVLGMGVVVVLFFYCQYLIYEGMMLSCEDFWRAAKQAIIVNVGLAVIVLFANFLFKGSEETQSKFMMISGWFGFFSMFFLGVVALVAGIMVEKIISGILFYLLAVCVGWVSLSVSIHFVHRKILTEIDVDADVEEF